MMPKQLNRRRYRHEKPLPLSIVAAPVAVVSGDSCVLRWEAAP